MNFDELIYKRLSESSELTEMLSSFCGQPSIFTPDIPEHNQSGWSEDHYPLLTYNYNLQANAERNSAGTLEITMLCQNNEETPIEKIEATIRDRMRDVIIIPEDGVPYCFAWARTDGFTIEENTNLGLTIGNEIRFDILELPSMITTDPDPVMAVERYVKEMYPECLVLGYERASDIEEATVERPVIYCRLQSSVSSDIIHTVAWRDCVVAIHVMCPDIEVRVKMATAIANKLSVDAEINMFDDSPMFVTRLQANYRADYLKDGQIFLTGHYGILRTKAKTHTLRNMYYEG